MSIVKFEAANKAYLSIYLYIQMEYCSGENIEKFMLSRFKNDREQNYDIMSQIVDGVASIHEQGMVHRDLKPKNIFLQEGNQIKIGDFGLAKKRESFQFIQTFLELSTSGEKSQGSGAAGTRRYMAPE